MKLLVVSRVRAGFTLIELMVVIAIIAIIASILLPSFVRARAQGQLSGCMENLHNIGVAHESYLVDYGNDPPMNSPGGNNPFNFLVPQYLKKIPTCPASGAGTLVAGNGSVVGYGWEMMRNYTPNYWTVFCVGAHSQLYPINQGPIGPYYSPRVGVSDGSHGFNP